MLIRINTRKDNDLQWAYEKRDIEEFKDLIKNGANVNCLSGTSGFSLLESVVLNANDIEDNLNKLFFNELLNADVHLQPISNGANVLELAIKFQNDIHYMSSLLQAGFSVDDIGVACDMNIPRKRPSPIYVALDTGDRSKIELILKYKPNLELRCHGVSPILHYFIQNCKPEIFDLFGKLIESGADINAINYNNESVLHAIASKEILHNKKEIFELLINHNIDINLKNKQSRTSLELACFSNNTDVINFCIENNAIIDEKDEDGITISMKCASNKKYNSLKILLKNGASTLVTDNKGNTIAHYIIGQSTRNRKITKVQIDFFKKLSHLLFTENNVGMSVMKIIKHFYKDRYQEIYDTCIANNKSHKNER